MQMDELHSITGLSQDGVLWPDYSLSVRTMPHWTWQLDEVIQQEVALIDPLPDLMDWYPSIPLFSSQELFQDDVCNLFDVEADLPNHDRVIVRSNREDDEDRDRVIFCKRRIKELENSRVYNLTFEEVSRYFYMPITQAAKELNIGLTLLKKKCRELGIPRWPHRKIKSLQTLIKNVQELRRGEGEADEMRSAIEILEEEKEMMEKKPSMQLEEKTKRLRQACFKANYKKRKLNMVAQS